MFSYTNYTRFEIKFAPEVTSCHPYVAKESYFTSSLERGKDTVRHSMGWLRMSAVVKVHFTKVDSFGVSRVC